MPHLRPTTVSLVALVAVVTCPHTTAHAAPKEKVLFSFGLLEGGQNVTGAVPNGGLILDASGNLYGTTGLGGNACNAGGIVFELIPRANGTWREKILHNFPCSSADGSDPNGNLIFDSAGNLYGTTACGGRYAAFCSGYGGTVFQLTPTKDGHWKERILHSFGHDRDGEAPSGGLVSDADGNLCGTTVTGGIYGVNCDGVCGGTVFELSQGKNGHWTEKVLHNFKGSIHNYFKDGFGPYGPLAIDASGNLYGTTAQGGPHTCYNAYGCGLAFELSPNQDGRWSYKAIRAFDGRDGYVPGPLILDAAGNLYGTTAFGGAKGCTYDYKTGCGTAFELVPGADGKWTENVLHPFYKPREPEGGFVTGGLTFDAAGNLYGTSWAGGAYFDGNEYCVELCGGTVFELHSGADGRWLVTNLHNFGAPGTDDANDPAGSLVFDASGNLYGASQFGGDQCSDIGGCGTVFEITP